MADRKFTYCQECGRQMEYEFNRETGRLQFSLQSGCRTSDDCQQKAWRKLGIVYDPRILKPE